MHEFFLLLLDFELFGRLTDSIGLDWKFILKRIDYLEGATSLGEETQIHDICVKVSIISILYDSPQFLSNPLIVLKVRVFVYPRVVHGDLLLFKLFPDVHIQWCFFEPSVNFTVYASVGFDFKFLFDSLLQCFVP